MIKFTERLCDIGKHDKVMKELLTYLDKRPFIVLNMSKHTQTIYSIDRKLDSLKRNFTLVTGIPDGKGKRDRFKTYLLDVLEIPEKDFKNYKVKNKSGFSLSKDILEPLSSIDPAIPLWVAMSSYSHNVGSLRNFALGKSENITSILRKVYYNYILTSTSRIAPNTPAVLSYPKAFLYCFEAEPENYLLWFDLSAADIKHAVYLYNLIPGIDLEEFALAPDPYEFIYTRYIYNYTEVPWTKDLRKGFKVALLAAIYRSSERRLSDIVSNTIAVGILGWLQTKKEYQQYMRKGEDLLDCEKDFVVFDIFQTPIYSYEANITNINKVVNIPAQTSTSKVIAFLQLHFIKTLKSFDVQYYLNRYDEAVLQFPIDYLPEILEECKKLSTFMLFSIYHILDISIGKEYGEILAKVPIQEDSHLEISRNINLRGDSGIEVSERILELYHCPSLSVSKLNEDLYVVAMEVLQDRRELLYKFYTKKDLENTSIFRLFFKELYSKSKSFFKVGSIFLDGFEIVEGIESTEDLFYVSKISALNKGIISGGKNIELVSIIRESIRKDTDAVSLDVLDAMLRDNFGLSSEQERKEVIELFSESSFFRQSLEFMRDALSAVLGIECVYSDFLEEKVPDFSKREDDKKFLTELFCVIDLIHEMTVFSLDDMSLVELEESEPRLQELQETSESTDIYSEASGKGFTEKSTSNFSTSNNLDFKDTSEEEKEEEEEEWEEDYALPEEFLYGGGGK